MKKLSITKRITLWYTSIMLVIVLAIIILVGTVSRNIIRENTRESLVASIANAKSYISFEEGVLKIDDKVEKIYSGIYLSIYDKYGNLLKGQVPRTFNMDLGFEDRLINLNILPNGERYYYYDELVEVLDFGQVRIRAITSYSNAQEALDNIFKTTLLVLPILSFLILLTGYYVTRQALKPMETIRKKVDEITEGADLDKRLDMPESRDEIYLLAKTFDNMLDRLEASFEREKQFTSDISHELRTPTTIIRLKSEALLVSDDLGDSEKNDIRTIQVQSEKMSKLISQMLFMTRGEKGEYEIEYEEIKLNELVEILIEELEDLAGLKNIEIFMDFKEDIYLKSDRTLVIQILNNLLVNSISYGKEGGETYIVGRKIDGEIIIDVIDNGRGIGEENINKIWDRFYQIDSARTNDTYGSGLGLSIVKWSCGLLGWEIGVKSKLGLGSKFTIRI